MLIYVITFCAGLILGQKFDSQAYVAKIDDKVITLEQDTGWMADAWWQGNFNKAAKYHCGTYEVMEKSETPSTLLSTEIKKNYYYWVVKCK